jgi:adenosylcobinamide kinase/adenosylcobinamide-phosphate guanylyltransferase
MSTPHRTLILGGARSGKSAEAERRLADAPAVTYVATYATKTGTGDGDPEWADRVAAHRARRPSHWRTIETTDVARVLRESDGAILVDGLGLWLTAVLDECGAWTDTSWRCGDTQTAVSARVDDLLAAWGATAAHVVAVSDEVGMSVVPQTAAGRRFQDQLGLLNQRLAAASDEVLLVVAGRVLVL